jgi:hypothetical protein
MMTASILPISRSANAEGSSTVPYPIQSRFEEAERAVLRDLRVPARLAALTSTPSGLSDFIAAFHFCRVGFVRANFILGARCPDDERYWVGLARNLFEEAGGGVTPPHNTLYRRLLARHCSVPEASLTSPLFAKSFDDAWLDIARSEEIRRALLAFAIYEVLDAPDYQMLYEVLRSSISDDLSLEFFRVHTDARHVELFSDCFDLFGDDQAFAEAADAMGDKVISLQSGMWAGLLDHLEASRMA